MRTILINTNTGEAISPIFENGYNMPIPETYVKEIEVVNTPVPVLEANQYAKNTYEYLGGKWQRVWQIIDNIKTEYELACEDWVHMDYAIRIIAPIKLALVYPAIEVWFRLNEFPIEKRGGNMLLYCNEVMEEHESLIEANKTIIFIENRPIEPEQEIEPEINIE